MLGRDVVYTQTGTLRDPPPPDFNHSDLQRINSYKLSDFTLTPPPACNQRSVVYRPTMSVLNKCNGNNGFIYYYYFVQIMFQEEEKYVKFSLVVY